MNQQEHVLFQRPNKGLGLKTAINPTKFCDIKQSEIRGRKGFEGHRQRLDDFQRGRMERQDCLPLFIGNSSSSSPKGISIIGRGK